MAMGMFVVLDLEAVDERLNYRARSSPAQRPRPSPGISRGSENGRERKVSWHRIAHCPICSFLVGGCAFELTCNDSGSPRTNSRISSRTRRYGARRSSSVFGVGGQPWRVVKTHVDDLRPCRETADSSRGIAANGHHVIKSMSRSSRRSSIAGRKYRRPPRP